MADQYSAESMIKALQQTKGNISAAAAALKCSRQTVTTYIKKYPTIRQALEDEREAVLDTAESALYRAILNGEAWAVCFTLKTVGKQRGYVERQELTGVDGSELVIKIVRE